jgi:hypothetical protein
LVSKKPTVFAELLVVVTSRYSRVNTQVGALSLVASRLFQTPEKAKGQDPFRRMDYGSPEDLK